MRIILIEILLITFIGSVAPVSSLSAETGWNEVGVRMGIQIAPKREHFHQYEVFAVYGLPWDWRDSSGWGLTPHVETSLGALKSGRETGFIGSVGSALVLNKLGSGFTTDFGLNVNLLDRRQLGFQDFGSVLQFGAYLVVNYCLTNGLKFGYRIQHISNAHVFYAEETPNPGLDMHLFGISYVF